MEKPAALIWGSGPPHIQLLLLWTG